MRLDGGPLGVGDGGPPGVGDGGPLGVGDGGGGGVRLGAGVGLAGIATGLPSVHVVQPVRPMIAVATKAPAAAPLTFATGVKRTHAVTQVAAVTRVVSEAMRRRHP